MLILDKEIEINELIVTVTENVTTPSPSFVLKLYSSFSKKNYSVDLGVNNSNWPNRYDFFKVDQSSFNQFEAGFYNYKIYEETRLTEILEQGYLKVKEAIINPVIRPVEVSTDNDFIVYKEK